MSKPAKDPAFFGKTSQSKVDRYGWKTVDKPGVFLFIPKGDLRIDDHYQRGGVEKQDRIATMASEWSWLACSALTVADRHGEFYVMDGQGRKLAADRRSDINELPCMVYETDDRAQEAKGFLRINVDRRAILASQKFKALLEADDPYAKFVDKLITSVGRHVSTYSSSQTVSCVGLMLSAAAADQKALVRVWPTVAKLCEGNSITGNILGGAFSLERRALNGASLSASPWSGRLVRVGYDAVSQSIAKARAYHSSGGAFVCAQGIANAMNKGVRYNRVEFKHADASAPDDFNMHASIPEPGGAFVQ